MQVAVSQNFHNLVGYKIVNQTNSLFNRLSGSIQYSTALFDKARIERMSMHFLRVLDSAISHPSSRIVDLPILPEAEHKLVTSGFNSTQQEYREGLCCQNLIEEQALKRPNKIAISFLNAHLTYSELNARANILAHYLRRAGVGHESLVGVFMNRSPEMIIAMIAILKAGGAYIMIDPHYPEERISYMFRDANMPAVITQTDCINRIPPENKESSDDHVRHSLLVVIVDRHWEHIQKAVGLEGRRNPGRCAGQGTHSLVYVVYTSGSTGKPKGVMIEHRGLLNYIQWHHHEYKTNASDRASHVVGIAFDAVGIEVWPTLTSGAT